MSKNDQKDVAELKTGNMGRQANDSVYVHEFGLYSGKDQTDCFVS